MLIVDILFALVFALLFAALLVWPFSRSGPGPASGFVFFALLLFLAIWAGGIWLEPVGPGLWGRPFLSFLIIGLVIMLLLAAAVPPVRHTSPPVSAGEAAREVEREQTAATAVGVFFWILLVVFIASIVARYAIWPT
jgi:hypothetical protein